MCARHFYYSRFSELLALAEDFEEMRTTRVLRQVPSRRASQATALLKTSANSGSGSSSSKSKKSAHPEDSDSADEFSDVSCYSGLQLIGKMLLVLTNYFVLLKSL